jgi:hypothetical protein
MPKRPKQGQLPSGENDDSSVESVRFDTSKPQFRVPEEASSKVLLDDRFASVLTDERFQLQVQDKYGRKTKHKKSVKEELSAFYAVEGQDQDNELDKSRKTKPRSKKTGAAADNKPKIDEPDIQAVSASRIAYLTAHSRGQIDASSSSSEGEDSGDSDSDSDDDASGNDVDAPEENAGVFDRSARDADVELTEDPTRYLAVTNMDWTNVRALDIFALISSFVATGALRKVRVFVSDFGQEKMSSLERFGPTGLWKCDSKRYDGDESNASLGCWYETRAYRNRL